MRILVVFIVAFVALAAAERDWSKIFSNVRKVAPVNDHRIPHKPSNRITNGNEAVPHSRPWQVALIIAGHQFCGGSLIDEQNVLTAAHCVHPLNGDIDVLLGAHNIREDEASQVVLTVSPSDYLQHEQYNSSNLRNDIGLMRLPSPVTLNEYIQPMPADNSSCSDDYTGQEANVSGWGMITDSNMTTSPVLREVTVPVISNDDCVSYYGEEYVQPTNLCTDGTGGKSICFGDSGGPLVHDGKQVGVVSYVSAHGCESGDPAGFTRVCQFRSWIEENRKK